MALQNFIDNTLPTIKAAWLNQIDAFVNTLFGGATTAAQARTALGANANGSTIFTGASAIGASIATAADAPTERNILGVGSVLSFRNKLINANFFVNQRVASSGNSLGSGVYFLDRWRSASAANPVTWAATGVGNTLTIPAGKAVEQVIEGNNIEGGVYTLSWIGTATATVNGVAITNGGQTSPLTANTNTTIQFSSGTVYLPQFELGSVPTAFEQRGFGFEFTLCLRYCQKSYPYATAVGTVGTAGLSQGGPPLGGTLVCFVSLQAPMRVNPSITLWDSNSNANSWISITSAGVSATRAASVGNVCEKSFTVNISTTDAVGQGHWLATAEL